jgi:hypothetical protein
VRDDSPGAVLIHQAPIVITYTEEPKEPPTKAEIACERERRRKVWWNDVGKPLLVYGTLFGGLMLIRACRDITTVAWDRRPGTRYGVLPWVRQIFDSVAIISSL